MIQIKRSRYINASPEEVFDALSDPQNLSQLLPRVSRVEVLERNGNQARIATHMSMGPLGDMRSEGNVSWNGNREITFEAKKPVTVRSHWVLTPLNSGTEVSVLLALDLKPMMGPLAAFVPVDQVKGMMEPDLDNALAELERRIQPKELELAA